MKMSIVTSMEELQEGDHLVSEEIYKEIAVLILNRTHPELIRRQAYLMSFLAILVMRAGGTLTIANLSRYANINVELGMKLETERDRVIITAQRRQILRTSK